MGEFMKKKRKVTTDAIEILNKTFIKGNKKRIQHLEKIREDLDIAEQIYNLRTQAGLTQQELAKLVGTSQSDISRLEDADYDGYSMKMLQKISAALHCKVKVSIVPENGRYAYAC
jgi:ribosome-binding protein aMBF1 (putative translation factor)